MVFVTREQPAKQRRRMTLFGLGGSSKKPNNQQRQAPLPSKQHHINVDEDDLVDLHPSTDMPPIPASYMQQASHALPAMRASPRAPGMFDRRQNFNSRTRMESENRQRRETMNFQEYESDEEAMDRSVAVMSKSEKGSPVMGATLPDTVLSRIQDRDLSSQGHSRQRSHFSIPDVVITSCEEEGQEVHVELKIPPNKRRSFVIAKHPGTHNGPQQHASIAKAAKKAGRGLARPKPPLVKLDIEGLDNPSSPTGLGGGDTQSVSPASPASSTFSKGSSEIVKRSRKSSFPLLFGKKGQGADSPRTSPVDDVGSPTHVANPAFSSDRHNVYDSSSTASSIGPLATFSCESNPGGAQPPAASKAVDLPSPPITPVSPTRSLTKKEMKAKEKEELALIKELEKVDKMVRQHDNKTRKAAEKAEAKEKKRLAAVKKASSHESGSSSTGSGGSNSLDTGPTTKGGVATKAFKRMTIFSASSKAGRSAKLGRRNSALRKRESHLDDGVVNRRSDGFDLREPKGGFKVLGDHDRQKHQQPGPSSGSPPATPPRPPRPPSLPLNKRRSIESPTSESGRPPKITFTSPASSEASSRTLNEERELEREPSDSDEIERGDATAWGSPKNWSWTELDDPADLTFTSLIKRDAGPSPNAPRGFAPPTLYRPLVGASAPIGVVPTAEVGTKRDSGSTLSRRSSIQRVLAMVDAEDEMLRKRASLRRRGSKQRVGQAQRGSKRASRVVDEGGDLSRTSSISSDLHSSSNTKRRSFIGSSGGSKETEWTPTEGIEELSGGSPVEWVDSKPRADELVLLNDLRAAQAASMNLERVLDSMDAADDTEVEEDGEEDHEGQRTPLAAIENRPIEITPATMNATEKVTKPNVPLTASPPRAARPPKSARRSISGDSRSITPPNVPTVDTSSSIVTRSARTLPSPPCSPPRSSSIGATTTSTKGLSSPTKASFKNPPTLPPLSSLTEGTSSLSDFTISPCPILSTSSSSSSSSSSHSIASLVSSSGSSFGEKGILTSTTTSSPSSIASRRKRERRNPGEPIINIIEPSEDGHQQHNAVPAGSRSNPDPLIC
ncbi:hypothetical protein IE53DRAFT_367698 [Violaceomyces palustris]|uniref:Uncharacterized protein n=1 Tax=Violaceomyces palustris TaxID=1673888 RepID=A0ACD0P1G3_9BASI|nr:hypothetical protein IE53DRAFT_367698 [Violaceomyces palustris]